MLRRAGKIGSSGSKMNVAGPAEALRTGALVEAGGGGRRRGQGLSLAGPGPILRLPPRTTGRALALAVGFGFAIGLSGCVVGPQYKGPPATKLTDFHNSAASDSR